MPERACGKSVTADVIEIHCQITGQDRTEAEALFARREAEWECMRERWRSEAE